MHTPTTISAMQEYLVEVRHNYTRGISGPEIYRRERSRMLAILSARRQSLAIHRRLSEALTLTEGAA